MYIALLLFACLSFGIFAFLRQPSFGEPPSGARLERMRQSPHYADGRFHNLVPTPQLTEGNTTAGVLLNFLFRSPERTRPARPLPSIKTDLRNLNTPDDVLVWFGHSSFFLRLDGKNVLIDPVFSAQASPLPFSNRAFEGTNVYAPEDLPPIDLLIISHDHWDHLDYRTVLDLEPKRIVCPLGVGAHLERFGLDAERIVEADWFESLEPVPGLRVHMLPARHFSGRDFRRDRTLWAGCALESRDRRIFYSGDSGYGPHFAEIAARLGGFDLTLLDSGQYNPAWKHMHMTPEEAAQAARDLRAKALLPAHVGKFCISSHPWDEPFIRSASAAESRDYRLLTPVIGELVRLDDREQRFSHWWEGLER